MAKTLEQEDIEIILGEVPHEKRFFCSDGKVFSTLLQLQQALPYMSKDTYLSHANREKNDFYNWIRDVVGDNTLALALLKSQSKEVASKEIYKRLQSLQSKLKKAKSKAD